MCPHVLTNANLIRYLKVVWMIGIKVYWPNNNQSAVHWDILGSEVQSTFETGKHNLT